MRTINVWDQLKAASFALSLVFAGATPAIAQDDAGCRNCLQSASGLFARGDNRGAAKLLSDWQNKCPDNLQLYLMLNTVLMRMPEGKKQALAAAEQACTIAPNNMLAHFQKAMTLMTLQEGPAAAKEFQRVVELDPTSYESWLALSELLGAQGKSQAAKEAEEHAAQLSPSARRSTLNALTSKDRAGNIQGLKQEVAKIVDNPSTSAETLLIVGEEVFALGYFAEAAQALSQAKNKYPDAPQIKTLLPYALFESGKYNDSAALIRADKSTAGSAALLAITGLNDLAAGNFSSGQTTIEKAAAGADNSGIVYLAQGYLAMACGHYKEAIERFSDAFKKNKNLAVAKIYIAQANLELGDIKEAISQARESQQKAGGLKVRAEAIELRARLHDGEDTGANIASLKGELIAFGPLFSPRDQAMADCALGDLSLKEGKSGRAREYFTSALGHDTNCPCAKIGMAQACILEGDDKSALSESDTALSRAPGSISALAIKALAQVGAGDMEGASASLTKATAEGELAADICLALGKAYKKAGDNKQSSLYLKQAMQAGLSGSDLEQAKEALGAGAEKSPIKQ